jgi:hypothetical protein
MPGNINGGSIYSISGKEKFSSGGRELLADEKGTKKANKISVIVITLL